jgi:hypothetical protein
MHVIIIAHSPEYLDVFAHEEYSWLRHPIKHLRQVGIEREAGRNKMRRWIESHGIEVDAKSRSLRRASHMAKDLHRYLTSIVQ